MNALGFIGARSPRVVKIPGNDGAEAVISGVPHYAWGYSALAQLGATGARLLGTDPNIFFRKDAPFGSQEYPGDELEIGKLKIPLGGWRLTDTFTNPIAYTPDFKVGGLGALARLKDLKVNKDWAPMAGDKMTIVDVVSHDPKDVEQKIAVKTLKGLGSSEIEAIGIATGNWSDSFMIPGEFEAEKNGMPFYFKDLRDNSYIVFRAYLEGISENLSPSWTPQNYIGRSEPVYIYERSERDVSFNLKLYAQTPHELDAIYRKLNRLTSLCYPQYHKDTKLQNKERMKPPLTKFRMGELYGSQLGGEVTGFIKTISYSYPDSGTWETKKGKRVPKYITAAITYQIIHKETPSIRFTTPGSGWGVDFYGINSHEDVGVQ